MKKVIFFISGFLLLIPLVRGESLELAPQAKSALLMEASTGTVLYAKDIHSRYAPASMTKIMSMLLIAEAIDQKNLKWNELITVSAHASGMGGSQIYLETGEVMSVKDLVKAIAIGSANDATVALAERIGGTEDHFVELMNQRAIALGLKNTNFKNASGLDAANHYSSAYDMAMMARALVKYEEILKFTSIYETYLRESSNEKFWLVNTNNVVP